MAAPRPPHSGSADQLLDLFQRGRLAEAENLCRRILAGDKDQFAALHILGLIEAQRGNLSAALQHFSRTATLNPRSVEAHVNVGRVLGLLARQEEALASYDKALAIDPNFLLALNNRGGTLRALGRLDEALLSYGKALAIRPDYPDALYNRGNVLTTLERHDEALESYDRALALRCDDAKVLIARGNALMALHRFADALASFERALAVRPRDAMSLYNRGNVLSFLRRYDEAATSYRQALEIEPDHRYAFSGLADCAAFTCDWRDHARLSAEVAARVRDRRSIIHPFTFLAYCDEPALQLACAQSFVDDTFPSPPPGACPIAHMRRDRIRVAYVSADFRNHAMSHLMSRLLELHDRRRFEVHGVSLGQDDNSPIRQRVAKAVDRFHDAAGRNDGDVAALIRSLDIDIAVDLTGHTKGNRIGIFARRAAPLQVSYLGFPGTGGTRFIDYMIADDIVVPPGADVHYSERVIRLPGCYWVDNRERAIPDTSPASRQEGRRKAALPESGVVLCSFNNNYKITPAVFDVWMRLLRAVDGSVLWLLRDNATVEQNLQREAVVRGIDASRLVFRERLPLPEHLASHQLADLFLDTVPVNAHTTAGDALWTGLPVVTCLGGAFAGRVAASLLQAAGVPELVTRDLAGYEALALKLATDPDLRHGLRAKLEDGRQQCPLFDTDRFRRSLEAALMTMWDIRQRGEAPQSFDVAPAA
jgi:predicted O-linked N-acetylglucosamine transferase (SPINDLY family)